MKSHPSIILFAGNNENEGALADNWYGTSDNFTLYKKDYVTLYIDTVGEEYIRLTNNRSIFLSSSPSNGLETAKEGYVSSNPGNNLYGDGKKLILNIEKQLKNINFFQYIFIVIF